jgi:hypothetical protein
MSTLIASGSSGTFRRACNAKCYNAKRPECDCLCGGINHGVGEPQARKNCRSMGVAWTSQAGRLVSFQRRRRFVPEQGRLFLDLVNEPQETALLSLGVIHDEDKSLDTQLIIGPVGGDRHIQDSFAF